MKETIELHVWGTNGDVSIIDPESRACAWLLCLHLSPQNIPFKIVTSSNTNLADTHLLPILLIGTDAQNVKYEGLFSISDYISNRYPSETKFIPDGKHTATELLVNLTLARYIGSTFHYVHLYNIYLNTKNYEQYTRKLFLQYLPFPMMYSQPLQFYQNACEQVKCLGLGPNKLGFLSFSEKVDDDDDDDEQDSIAMSALHERVMLAKQKDKGLLKETRNTLRCANSLDKFVTHVVEIFEELNPNSPVEFAHLFRPTRVSSSELLLYSYIYSLTKKELPDGFVATFLKQRHPAFWKFSCTIIEALNGTFLPEHFRAPSGPEVPSLLNEAAYQLGVYKY